LASSGLDYFRVTDQGALFYVPGRNEHSLVKVTRNGHEIPLTKRRAGYRLPRVSPDGRRVGVVVDPPDESDSDIWILDVERDALSRLTTSGHNLTPVWTADGNRVAWSLWANGQVHVATASRSRCSQRRPAPLLVRSRPTDERSCSIAGKG
jgi:hypothetical protein